jgi:benzoyl-CoA 2,3-dioxygenase component B
MKPMLQEEFYHLLTGHTGLGRVIKAGRVPMDIIQRHINKWFSVALDLFGVDASSSAEWFYVWGLKGRYDEATAQIPADRDRLNELARQHYLRELTDLIAALNRFVPEGQPRLGLPDIRFHRSIGEYAGMTYSVRGELLTPEEYAKHLDENLPGARDKAALTEIFKDPGWVLPV